MFKCKTPQDVETALGPKEYKQNELAEIVSKIFSEYDYKKISYILDSRTVVLNFDFPKTVPESINEGIRDFKAMTSWDIQINSQTNLNSLDNELKILLGASNIKKISHNINEGKVLVQLNAVTGSYTSEKETFKTTTGYELFIKDINNEASAVNLYASFDGGSNDAMEQNAAISHIDEGFKYEEFKPYKKSVRAKGVMELAFISPVVGRRYSDKISILAKETGWNLSISTSVNQNEVISTAVRLCAEENIELLKNPSFNPSTLEVIIKPKSFDEDKLSKVKESFDHMTGCKLGFFS
jgi:hypothetical protein